MGPSAKRNFFRPGRLTLANRLTIFRILCIPVFVLFVFHQKEAAAADQDTNLYRFLALIVFMLASVTDALDGYLARRGKQVSRLGTILDPLADKGLMVTTVLVLATDRSGAYTRLPLWFVVLLVSRDGVLLFGSLVIYMFTGRVNPKPHWTGKGASALTMFTLIWILAGLYEPVVVWLWRGAGALILISGLLYLREGFLQLQVQDEQAMKKET